MLGIRSNMRPRPPGSIAPRPIQQSAMLMPEQEANFAAMMQVINPQAAPKPMPHGQANAPPPRPQQPQQPQAGLMGQPQQSPVQGLFAQQFEKPKMTWSDKLGLISGMLMDYDGTMGSGNADKARGLYDQRVAEQQGQFEQNRQQQLMMAAASGDPMALAFLDPLGNRAFEYGKSRDQIGDQRFDRTYKDARGDRMDDLAFRDRSQDFAELSGNRSFDLQSELGRGNLSLGWAGHNLTKEQQEAEAAAGGTFGLNVVWGMDEQGNYVPMQAGKSGGLIASEMPEGVTPLGPYGTAFDTATGKEQAKRAAYESTAGQALLGFEAKADELVSQIDQAIEKSDFWNTGITGAAIWSPDFNAILDSIGAKAMLSELISIKAQGGTFGALSDAEGKALRDAAVNITKSQSEAQLDKNLQAYRDQVEKTRANMRKAFEDEYVNSTPNRRTPPGTGSAPQPATTPAGPPVGTVRNGYRFKGGNPNDRNSWEPAQ